MDKDDINVEHARCAPPQMFENDFGYIMDRPRFKRGADEEFMGNYRIWWQRGDAGLVDMIIFISPHVVAEKS